MDSLIEASMLGNYMDVSNLLLQKNTTNLTINYAFKFACQKNHCEIAKLLLANGANIDCFNGEPLKLACYNGRYDIVKLLLERGANFNIGNGEPLKWACQNGHYVIVKLILEKDVNFVSNLVLDYACNYKQFDMINMILSCLPKLMKSYIAHDLYKLYNTDVLKIFNNYNPIIYQLNGTIKYFPDILTLKNALFMGFI
jgi:ankyrin repeat protein